MEIEKFTHKIIRVGTSHAVIIPFELMEKLNLKHGERVEILNFDELIIIKPIKPSTEYEKLKEVVKRFS